MDEYAKDRYDIILGRYLLIELVLNIKRFKHFIEAVGGTFKGCTAPMIDFGMY